VSQANKRTNKQEEAHEAEWKRIRQLLPPGPINELAPSSKVVSTDPSSLDFIFKAIESTEKRAIKAQKLVYRGSELGFSSTLFHSHCDKKASLLVLVESTKNKIFGGYTGSTAYPVDHADCISSGSSFLFSVDHQEIYSNDGTGGIVNFANTGPIFGKSDGGGLILWDHCNQN